MLSAEARYIRRVGDHILEIMPESQRRKELLLNYLTTKILGPPRKMRPVAVIALMAISSVCAAVVDDLIQPTQAEDVGIDARIIEGQDGSFTLAVVQRRPGAPTLVLHREALTGDQAQIMLADPQWAERTLQRVARGS